MDVEVDVEVEVEEVEEVVELEDTSAEISTWARPVWGLRTMR